MKKPYYVILVEAFNIDITIMKIFLSKWQLTELKKKYALNKIRKLLIAFIY